MNKIGIIEGFFGPAWEESQRQSMAKFLANHGGDFYIYAPKRDARLRKTWKNAWNKKDIEYFKKLKRVFSEQKLRFGLGLSPFELEIGDKQKNYSLLLQKLVEIQDIGVDILGVFFDDMSSNAELAQNQINAMKIIENNFRGEIIFCPSYYSFDPILEKVFGKMPTNYMSDIANNISDKVQFAWTGSKVISSEISNEHLREVNEILKHKIFLWENYFANDGPKNCKFLKLKPLLGREKTIMSFCSGIGFNLMNQAELSKLLFLSAKKSLDGIMPEDAFKSACDELCSQELSGFILKHKDTFLSQGLDKIAEDEKKQYISQLENYKELMAKDIIDWLKGNYNVGPECLTD